MNSIFDKEKSMVRALFLFAFILLCTSSAFADVTLTECYAFRPSVLNKNIVKQSEIEELLKSSKNKKQAWGQTVDTNVYWEVFSDRSDNITYESPMAGSPIYKRLALGQKLRIAEIKNNYALVYEENASGLIYPKISRSAKSMGWIPMKHLLLWIDCPANESYIYKKALIVGNIDNARNDVKLGYYYTNPFNNQDRKPLHSTMNFFFQMKTDEDTGMVLLATDSRVSGSLKNLLYGWVSKGSFTEWEQRTCLEPNWDRNAVADLKGSSIPVKSATTGRTFTNIIIGGTKNHVSQKLDTEYRLEPNVLRYPVLSSGRDNYIATIFAKEGEANNSTVMADISKAEAAVSQAIENRSIVNVIMVIDGTKGMEKFFPYVKEAIKRAHNYFRKDAIVRTVKVGGVIYRDYTDGQYMTEILPMCDPKDSRVERFFSGGQYGIKNATNDQTDYEALYKGLETALDMKKMGYSRENFNLMFVIGDAGNAPDDKRCLSQEQIVRKCVENRIQLSSFLVRNIDSPASAQFRKQMRNIVMKNMEQQYAKLGSNIKSSYQELQDGYDFRFNVQESNAYFIGGFRHASQGQDMDEARLYSLVKSTSERFEECMSKIKSEVVNSKETAMDDPSMSNRDEAASAIAKNLIKDILGEQTFNALKEMNYIMAFRGSVPEKSAGGWDYWKPVIYISHPEFRELMRYLEPVMNAVENNPDDRKPYVEAMKALVRSMLPGLSEEKMMKMDNKEIMAQIIGLNVKTQALAGHSLVDIQNERAVSKEVFQGLVADFIAKYRKLHDLLNDRKYPFTTKRNGVPFYWIPAEDLP